MFKGGDIPKKIQKTSKFDRKYRLLDFIKKKLCKGFLLFFILMKKFPAYFRFLVITKHKQSNFYQIYTNSEFLGKSVDYCLYSQK